MYSNPKVTVVVVVFAVRRPTVVIYAVIYGTYSLAAVNCSPMPTGVVVAVGVSAAVVIELFHLERLIVRFHRPFHLPFCVSLLVVEFLPR